MAAVTADGSFVMLTKPALGACWSPESNLAAVLHWSLHEPGVLVQAGSLLEPIAGISTDQYSAVCRWLWHRAGQALEELHALGLCGGPGAPPAVSAGEQSQGAPAGPEQAGEQARAHLLRLRQLLFQDDAAAAHARQLGPHNAPGLVQSVTAATQGGTLVECKRLSRAQHSLLLAVQQAAVRAPELRPLGGLGLAQEEISHGPGGVVRVASVTCSSELPAWGGLPTDWGLQRCLVCCLRCLQGCELSGMLLLCWRRGAGGAGWRLPGADFGPGSHRSV